MNRSIACTTDPTLLMAALVVLSLSALFGCANQPTPSPPRAEPIAQARKPVEGLCKVPDLAPAEVAHKPGYAQFAVSITDSGGRPVTGLKQQDLLIYSAAQTFPLAYFRENNNDQPLAIAIVVDTSGSMTPKLQTVKQSLGKLITNLNRCDEVSVIAFSSRTFLLLPLSTNHEHAIARMDLLHAYGQTAMFDATSSALTLLADADYPNRIVILITDGIDNSSKATREQVVAQVKKDGVAIYAIGIGDPQVGPLNQVVGPFVVSGAELDRVDAESLKAFSGAAGGRTSIVPATPEDAGDAFTNAMAVIADNIAHSYTVGVVVPPGVDLSSVYLTVANRRSLSVQARPVEVGPKAD